MDNLIIVAAAIVVVIVLILITGYVKAPTDTAVIISGLKKEPKYVIGRSSIKIPFLQRTDKLTLKMISVDVKTEESVPTNDYINVNIDSAVKVKVSMDPEKMKLAASNFLNKNEEYIRSSVVDVLQGNVREIIGQMKLEEIVQDRKKFADKVQENAAPDMAKMGLDIVSFNVQNVTDKGNVIENLGIDRVVTISKSAQISKAESERDIAVAKAAADKQANDAKRQGLFCRIPQHKKLVQMRLAEMALRKSNMSFRHCRLIRQRILTNFQKSFLSLGMESVTSCGNLTVVL